MQDYFEKNRFDFSQLINKIKAAKTIDDVILDEETDIEIYGANKVSKDVLISILQEFNILDNLVQDECKNEYEQSNLNIICYQFAPGWIKVSDNEIAGRNLRFCLFKKKGEFDMYFKLNNYEYNVISCSVNFDLVPENQTLRMFIDVDASTDNENVEYELQNIRLYHNNGFCIGTKDVKKLKRKKFEWLKSVNKKGEEAGTMYVLEHEDISSGTIEILDITKDLIKIRWVGLANIFWDDEFGENVPFETEIESKLPEIPKEKVLNGFKKTKLKIDKVTELEILNFPDILKEEERCCALWRQNDSKAWDKFNAILHLKLTYNGEEYLGRAIYAGSTYICKVEFDDACPLVVEFTKTTIDTYNESYNFYVMVNKK